VYIPASSQLVASATMTYSASVGDMLGNPVGWLKVGETEG